MDARQHIEGRFGPLGCGQQRLLLNGIEYDLATLIAQLGLEFDDMKPIDVQSVDGHYVVRYFDAQDARVVAYEFDAHLHPLQETRAHIAEWMGEQAYFAFYAGH
jgi:hypothetical protein